MKSQHGIIFSSLVVASCCLIAAEGGSCQASGNLRGRSPHLGNATNRTTQIAVNEASPTSSSSVRSNDEPVGSLSTGWFNQKNRCHNSIIISGNGRRVKATGVDECDSTKGCDAEHDFQPSCPNNVVDASRAIWKALGVPHEDWGQLDIE